MTQYVSVLRHQSFRIRVWGFTALQALQQLWESARFTYQVNKPTAQVNSHRAAQTPASRLKSSTAESEPEAESDSDIDGEEEQGNQQMPLPGSSQVVTRHGHRSTVSALGVRPAPKPFLAFSQPSAASAVEPSSATQPRQSLLSSFVSKSTPQLTNTVDSSQHSMTATPDSQQRPGQTSLVRCTVEFTDRQAVPEAVQETNATQEVDNSQLSSSLQAVAATQAVDGQQWAEQSQMRPGAQSMDLTPAGAGDIMRHQDPTPADEYQVQLQGAAAQPMTAEEEEMHMNASASQEEELQRMPEMTQEPAESNEQQLQFDLLALRANLKRRREAAAASTQMATQGRSKRACFEAASLQGTNSQSADDDASAAQELDRVFNQADFPRMHIIGQFNLGFIVARLGQDLFIIDQHASDEKYNFERLASTTTLNKQPLLLPQTLDLSPGESVTVREHLDVFAQNGFDIQQQANGQLALAAVPFSKNTTFGRDDVLELIGILGGHGDHQGQMSMSAFPSAATMHRPSRVRAMLAMRACRSSIMIGKALDMKTMAMIVSHLGGLESPWNCPHGRPTMRHLTVLQ